MRGSEIKDAAYRLAVQMKILIFKLLTGDFIVLDNGMGCFRSVLMGSRVVPRRMR